MTHTVKNGYKKTKIGWIPDNWQLVRLKNLAHESKERNDDLLERDYLYAVTKLEGMIPMRERVQGKGVERCKIVRKDYFAYNPMRINIGSIARWYDVQTVMVSPDYVVFHCDKEKLDPDYLDHFRQSNFWESFMKRAGSGSVRVRIWFSDLGLIQVPLPPLPEQRKIAEILSTWDEVIDLTQQLITAKQRRKKALMQQLLTGKVRFPGFDGEWKKPKFKEILNIEIGGTPSRNKSLYWDTEKITENRWLSIADLNGKFIYDSKEYISDQGVKNSNTKLVPAETVVMSFKLTIGRAAILEKSAYTNEAICSLIPKKEKILLNRYLYHALYIVNFDKEIDQAVKGKTLNKAKLNRLQIHLPSYSEQVVLADFFDLIDEEIDLLQQKLAALQTQKKGLMQQLLTGQVRVEV